MVRRLSQFPQPVLLALLTTLLLLPFCGRAFFVDDPLFVWAAQHIARHPFNPYGFDVNWYGISQPMSVVTQNPPLTCYFIALAGALFGYSEAALHLAFLLPAIAFALGTYQLAQTYVRRPLVPACIALASPAFFISATSVMSDVLMGACLTWACVIWLRAFATNRIRDFVLAGLLLSLAFGAKYFAILLLPIWILNGLMRAWRRPKWLWAIALPCLFVAAYETWTAHLYGQGLFRQAMEYASWARSNVHIPLTQNLLEGLVFDGGCALPLVFLAPALWCRRLPAFVAVIPLILAILWYFGGPGNRLGDSSLNSLDDWTHPGTLVQGAVLLMGGLALPVLLVWAAARAGRVHPAPGGELHGQAAAATQDLWFLIGWVGVTFVFGTELNWTLSARSTLPMIPPLAILTAMRLESRSVGYRALTISLVAAMLATLLISQGDTAQANSERQEAKVAQRGVAPKAHALWCCGAWGFAYYLRQLGVPAFDSDASRVNRHDYFLTATNVANTQIPAHAIPEGSFPTRLFAVASTINLRNDAGFYSTEWGQLPFSFYPAPGSETCTVYGLDPRQIRPTLPAAPRHG